MVARSRKVRYVFGVAWSLGCLPNVSSWPKTDTGKSVNILQLFGGLTPRTWVPGCAGMTKRRLFDLRAGFLDELRPAGDVFLDEGAEFLGRVADRLESEVGHALADLGVFHGGDEERVELLDDGAWGAGGSEDAVPAEDVEAGEAGFGDGGKVGREGGALGGGDGEAADAAGVDLRQAGRADGET